MPPTIDMIQATAHAAVLLEACRAVAESASNAIREIAEKINEADRDMAEVAAFLAADIERAVRDCSEAQTYIHQADMEPGSPGAGAGALPDSVGE